jgi:hypothetical protein
MSMPARVGDSELSSSRGRARPVSARMHALSDAIILSAGLVAPSVLGYADGVAALYTYAIVASGVLLNLLTDYPLGVLRKVPLRVHRMIELTGPGVFIVLPWLLFPGPAAWVLSVIGAINFATAALTDA